MVGAGSAGTGNGGIDGALRSGRLWLVPGVFFGAGLLLSFTPCVLPMLPILSSIIGGQAGRSTSRARLRPSAGVFARHGAGVHRPRRGRRAGRRRAGGRPAKPVGLGGFALMLAALSQSLSMFGFYELQLPASLRDRLDARASRFKGGQ